ncbi:ribonuclease Z [Thermogladius sp. KZ2Tp1]|uniref:ribonuclease Z n=1 Tax=Thermogladius sp. KZ2Tp1 TaxID=3136289 RepID=UPI003DA908E2
MNGRIVFLGTGAAIPINRGLPCLALKVNSSIYLLDAGEGCQHRLFKAGLSPLKVKTVFITHGHGDHYLGLFGLVQSMNLLGRDSGLNVVAPEQVAHLVSRVLENMLEKVGFEINIVVGKTGEVYKEDDLEVTPYPVCHTVEAHGYLVRVGDKTVSYTGDTRPCPSIVEYSKNASILIHEATFASEYSEEALKQGHSTARDAALAAREADVGLLVLTHLSSRYKDDTAIFVDAYRFFRKSVVARDYMTLIL